MSEYKDYNFKSDSFSHAMNYLLTPLMNIISPNNGPILDVGCGNGSLVNHLLAHKYSAYGIDASVSGIEIAKKQNHDHFYLQDLSKDKLPVELQDIDFRTIISTEVIEHLYDPRHYVKFCKNILQKSGGGDLIITTPYHGYLKNLTLSIFNGWDNHFTVLWDGGHIKFWSKKTLSKLLEEQNFKIIQFKGCGRIPYFWKSMIIQARIENE